MPPSAPSIPTPEPTDRARAAEQESTSDSGAPPADLARAAELDPEPKARAPQGERDAHIELQGVGKRFGDFWALQDIDLTVRRGAIEVIIGGSGAGKTTLLKLLIALDRPTEGIIRIDGVDTTKLQGRALNDMRKKLGMVFQYSALLDSMNVLDNVAFPLREHRRDLSRKEIETRVQEKLEALGLHDVEKRVPSELSGGMRKRVALARALMLEPAAIFYDEPTSGLDPLTARIVDDMIAETRERFGVTSVLISHDMVGAFRIADTIHLLDRGRLAISGAPHELAAGDHPLLRSFLESSGIAAEQLLAPRR